MKSKNQVYVPVSGVFRGFSNFLRISLSDTVHCLQIAFRPVTTPNTFSNSRRVYFPNENYLQPHSLSVKRCQALVF